METFPSRIVEHGLLSKSWHRRDRKPFSDIKNSHFLPLLWSCTKYERYDRQDDSNKVKERSGTTLNPVHPNYPNFSEYSMQWSKGRLPFSKLAEWWRQLHHSKRIILAKTDILDYAFAWKGCISRLHLKPIFGSRKCLTSLRWAVGGMDG